MYAGALADLNLGINPYTSNRYAFGAGNPITMVELDGHEPRPQQFSTTWGDPGIDGYGTQPPGDGDGSELPCEASTCIIDVLTGERALPNGFSEWADPRADDGSYEVITGANKGDDTRTRRADGGCSGGLRDTGAYWDFRQACSTHDLGYDLLRYLDELKTNHDVRSQIDDLMKADMYTDCSGRGVPGGPCRRLADSAWSIVYSNTKGETKL